MVCHASELQGQSFVCILYVGRNVYISYNDNGVRGFVVFAVCIIFSYDSLSICTKKHRIHRKIISDHTCVCLIQHLDESCTQVIVVGDILS